MSKRKKDGIKFNMFDERMLDFLAKFHCADIDNIREYCKYKNRSISKARLDLLIDKGYIQTDKIKINKEVIKVYFLDEKGKKYIKGAYRNTTSKAYKSTSKKHDYVQMREVMKRYDAEDIRKYYKSEFELEKAVEGSGESRPDGAFIFDDNRPTVYIETITQHYDDDMKIAKTKYVEARGGQYITIKTTV